jgi:hypothetical protein
MAETQVIKNDTHFIDEKQHKSHGLKPVLVFFGAVPNIFSYYHFIHTLSRTPDVPYMLHTWHYNQHIIIVHFFISESSTTFSTLLHPDLIANLRFSSAHNSHGHPHANPCLLALR